MSNTIGLAKTYAPMLDDIYKQASKTSVLDVAPAMVKAGRNSGTFYIPNLTLVGLGAYSKTTGYPAGDVVFAWEDYTYTQDRGRTFSIDAMDDLEAMGAFGHVAGQFIRRHVVPEVDAYRMATLAGTSGILGTTGVLDSHADVIAALNAAAVALEDAEVDDDRLLLFITPANLSYALTADIAEDKCPILSSAQVVKVPSTRMMTDITMVDGSSSSTGGYTETAGSANINFILMDKGAAFVDAKHDQPRVFTPEQNQHANAYKFDYRLYHDCFVYDQRVKGVYLHTDESPSP